MYFVFAFLWFAVFDDIINAIAQIAGELDLKLCVLVFFSAYKTRCVEWVWLACYMLLLGIGANHSNVIPHNVYGGIR